MRSPKVYTTPVAKSVPFDNSTNGFTATDTQSAIEEAKSSAIGTARYVIQCGFDGSASHGRYLEFIGNVACDQTPYVVAANIQLRELSISVAANATVTVSIIKNGSTVESISLSGSKKAIKTGLSVSFSALDEMQFKVTSGSCSKPLVLAFIQRI